MTTKLFKEDRPVILLWRRKLLAEEGRPIPLVDLSFEQKSN
jgi:hypothetical protein